MLFCVIYTIKDLNVKEQEVHIFANKNLSQI